MLIASNRSSSPCSGGFLGNNSPSLLTQMSSPRPGLGEDAGPSPPEPTLPVALSSRSAPQDLYNRTFSDNIDATQLQWAE